MHLSFQPSQADLGPWPGQQQLASRRINGTAAQGGIRCALHPPCLLRITILLTAQHAQHDLIPARRWVSWDLLLPFKPSLAGVRHCTALRCALSAAYVTLQKPLTIGDIKIRLEDVAICKRPDGSLWNLGQGSFGTGSLAVLLIAISSKGKSWMLAWHRSLMHLDDSALMGAVYKAVKGLKTVAVKSCHSLVSEKDQVGGDKQAVNSASLLWWGG